MRSTIGVIVVAAVLTACASSAPASPPPSASVDGGPIRASSSGAGFTLTLRVERGSVGENEAIEAVATLANETGAVATLSGSGSGVVFLSVTRARTGSGRDRPE